MTDDSFDGWTAEEGVRLAEVGQHRSPRDELKARTVAALRERRLIGLDAQRHLPRRLAIGLAAAATIVFAAGVLAGYGIASRRRDDAGPNAVTPVSSTAAREVARMDSASTQASTGRHVVWF
jgi:hypothetical protein